jgi:hypothetical protein
MLVAQNADYVYIPGGLLTGEDYLELGAQSRVAYAAGFFNGMSVAAAVVGDTASSGSAVSRRVTWLGACSKGMTDKQIAEIIRKEIQERPAEWHQPLNVLGLTAMLNACKEYRSSQPAGKN